MYRIAKLCPLPTTTARTARSLSHPNPVGVSTVKFVIERLQKEYFPRGQDAASFDLIDHLATLPNDQLPHEIDVQALVRRGVTTPIRLIILRKPAKAMEAARKTMYAQASREQKVLDPHVRR
jgi:hypothetical protein